MSGRYILHIDDNPGERRLVQEVFSEIDSDCDVVGFPDGDSAITFLTNQSHTPTFALPQLILMDLHIPRMSGMELLAYFKQHPTWNAVPIVMLTNSHAPSERSKSEQMDISGFERKPGTLEGYQALAYRLAHRFPQILRK